MDSHVELVENTGAYEELGEHLSNHSEQESHDESVSDGEETIPKGTPYPLYSKRLRIKCLRRIAGALGLATDASAAQTRKLIEEKLVEMDRQPTDVQVIVQGTNDDGNIFLVDESGIIKSIKGALKHVSGESRSDGVVRSVLRGSDSDTRQLRSMLDEQTDKVEALTAELRTAQQMLVDEQASSREKDTEITRLEDLLAKEKQRVKKHWREKCELLLAHEEALEEKDAEILLVRARIVSLTNERSAGETLVDESPVTAATGPQV